MKSLKLKPFVLAAGFVAASLSSVANAANVVATLSSPGSYTFSSLFSSGSGQLDTIGSFTLSASQYNGSVLGLTNLSNKTITFTSYQLFNSANIAVTGVNSIINGGNFAFANIQGLTGTDTYSLHLGYSATGAGHYDGRLQVSAVPEPETYGMMLAGLGLMGFVARRRKSA